MLISHLNRHTKLETIYLPAGSLIDKMSSAFAEFDRPPNKSTAEAQDN
jgi:hypothetical protein